MIVVTILLQFLVVDLVIVFLIFLASCNTGDAQEKRHESLATCDNDAENSHAVGLDDVGHEVLGDICVFVTTVVNKLKVLHRSLTLLKLTFLAEHEEESDSEENKLNSEATGAASFGENISALYSSALSSTEDNHDDDGSDEADAESDA